MKTEFEPTSIVLVGSRADGVARPESDWDIYVLIDDGNGPSAPTPTPRKFDGQTLDVALTSLSIPLSRVVDVFGPNLQQSRILMDDLNETAKALVTAAHTAYAKGRKLAPSEISQRVAQMRRNIETMETRRDEVGPFFEALAFVFYIAHRWWYEVTHDRWSQSVHRAMPEIAREDPEFHANLVTLASN
ncbi:MAG: nucleotidyltransferase domain-containing protein, partial [Pseudomonadales bacterium]